MRDVIITGASAGIGYEVARHLVRDQGCRVVAIARRAEALDRLAHQTAGGPGELIPLPLDLVGFDPGALSARIEALVDRVDVLINNAGALVHRPFAELTDGDWRRMLDVNLLAPARLIRALLPLLGGGHVLNISSMGGVAGAAKFPGLAAYSASKGALNTLTECLAEELGAADIRVNAIALGAVQTEMLATAFPGLLAPITAEQIAPQLADFALRGHRVCNGKILAWAVSTP